MRVSKQRQLRGWVRKQRRIPWERIWPWAKLLGGTFRGTEEREWRRSSLRACRRRSMKGRTSRSSSGRCLGRRPMALACRASPFASPSAQVLVTRSLRHSPPLSGFPSLLSAFCFLSGALSSVRFSGFVGR